MKNHIANHLPGIPRSGIRDFFEIVSTRDDIISLSVGEPDFVTPWHICEASVYALEHGATGYTANLGTLRLRKAISTYVQKSYQAHYAPEDEILITVGVSEAFDLAIRALVNPGDEVIYHEPCYVSYAPIIQFAHGVPVPVVTKRENEFRLSAQQIEKHITDKSKVLILNFPTNPTGAVLTRRELEEIAEVAIRHDLIVITDDIYSELTYDEERASIAAINGMKERTIFLNGFSKAWAMTGYRIGFSCSSPALTEAMMKIHQYTMLCAPVLAQEAAVEALENGSQDVVQMRDEYRRRRNVLHASLNDMGLTCDKPQGAFYAFPYIGDTGLSSKDFALRLLEEQSVACVPGTAFGSCGEGHLRCCYATSMQDLEEALKRIKTFVASL